MHGLPLRPSEIKSLTVTFNETKNNLSNWYPGSKIANAVKVRFDREFVTVCGMFMTFSNRREKFKTNPAGRALISLSGLAK